MLFLVSTTKYLYFTLTMEMKFGKKHGIRLWVFTYVNVCKYLRRKEMEKFRRNSFLEKHVFYDLEMYFLGDYVH